MTARWSSADMARKATAPKSPTVNPRTPQPPQTPPTRPASSEPRQTKRKQEDKTPVTPKARWQVATFPDYAGLRLVLHGLTPEQVQSITHHAEGLGVLEQN